MTSKKLNSWEVVEKNRQEICKNLSSDQKKALIKFLRAYINIRSSYINLIHPNIDDLVKLDNAFFDFKHYVIDSKDSSFAFDDEV